MVSFATPAEIQNPLRLQRIPFSINRFSFASLLLPHFFFLPSIDIGTAPQATRSLYNDLIRRAQGNSPFQHHVQLSLTLPTFAFCLFASFSLE
jgi:hypothetical protein